MDSHQGTSEPYGTEEGRGELLVWGGIVSARLEDIAGALETAPQAVLDAVEWEGIELVLDTARTERAQSTRPMKHGVFVYYKIL